jgi:hypothetical protein
LNLTEAWAPAGLWLAVVASGLYHGVNPGMGWPLVVSAGLIVTPRANFSVEALGSAAADKRTRPGRGIRVIRDPTITPQRHHKLTENDDYWLQKRRASF